MRKTKVTVVRENKGRWTVCIEAAAFFQPDEWRTLRLVSYKTRDMARSRALILKQALTRFFT